MPPSSAPPGPAAPHTPSPGHSPAASAPRAWRDTPPPAGAHLVPGGVQFCVYAGHADAVELCLFDAADGSGDARGSSERRLPLAESAHGYFWGTVPQVGAGQRYGYRAHGPWSPRDGMRHNDAKLLLDPYARIVEGEVTVRPEIFGHVVDASLHGDTELIDTRDSRAYVPRGVVVDEGFDWGTGQDADRHPEISKADSVIYEAHVRGLTKLLPGIPERLRGTYAGMAHPVTIEHLTGLGVTALELLPVHASTTEPSLVVRGVPNYWGYNTLGFFAPQLAYASTQDPQQALAEVKGMVRLLHAAGIEVILDVVYNHTCEGAIDKGATLSWRGLDSASYYRLDNRGADVDVTGCGNTLDLSHPVVTRMVLDSLRYWTEQVHVDGFRFDLAVALARGRNDDYDPDHPFLVALRADPALAQTKLIAEPWDLGANGWRTGAFPPPFSEWNDRYRDTTRAFWLADLGRDNAPTRGRGAADLATRLAGSQDVFGSGGRSPLASVNYVTSHDGFTLADLTRYDTKHNEANGEGNRDGTDDNLSWNHGVEDQAGVDETVAATRLRSARNILATLLLSTGVPMLCAGDELGRTQQGNNNAYCQDNPISWVDWQLADWQHDLLETTRFLTGLRRDYPVLRQRWFFEGRQVHEDGSEDLAWYDGAGTVMTEAAWNDAGTRTLQMALDGAYLGGRSVLLVMHGGAQSAEVTLAAPPGAQGFRLLWDSAWERPQQPQDVPGDQGPVHVTMTAASVRVYEIIDPT